MNKVTFTNFWPGFRPEKSFFYRYLNRNGTSWEISEKNADLEICSVFPKPLQQIRNKTLRAFSKQEIIENALINTTMKLPRRTAPKRVWYTGENIRVPFGEDFDYSLSYDLDDYEGKNFYFPLWQTQINIIEKVSWNSNVGAEVSVEELMQPRRININRPNLAVAFIGNTHPIRTRLVSQLSRVGRVDVYGKSVGKRVPYKRLVSENSIFAVCLENDLYPGYVTEKLLEAYISGNIPIYWGDLGPQSPFNPKSMINLKDFSGISECVEFISKLSADDLLDIAEQPLFHSMPKISHIEKALS